MLNTKFLEITAWSFNPYEPNEFLGEVLLDLSGKLRKKGMDDRRIYFIPNFSKFLCYRSCIAR